MQLPHPLVGCLGFFCLVGFLFGGLLWVLCAWLLVLVLFSLNIKLSWDPTENILVTLTVISTKMKIEHLTNTVLHFGGLVSSLTLGFYISSHRAFVDCPSKKHPIMLLSFNYLSNQFGLKIFAIQH